MAAGSFMISLHTARAQVSFLFDYTYDTGGFFTANSLAKTDLEAAASTLQSRLADGLSAITPGDGNSWLVAFPNPSTGGQQSINNPSVAANTVVVYVGARNLENNALGLGLFGDSASSGTPSWMNAVGTRGQIGAPAIDFGPWGGSISFSSTASWYFDPDPSTTESFAGQYDFYSVAVHELGHVLGFGTAPSWNNLVVGGQFTGPAAAALNGGNALALDPSRAHWAQNTLSTLPGTSTPQEAAMDPTLSAGARKDLTDLDWAGLNDIGWSVTPVPEPQAYATVALGLLAFALFRRRRVRRVKTV